MERRSNLWKNVLWMWHFLLVEERRLQEGKNNEKSVIQTQHKQKTSQPNQRSAGRADPKTWLPWILLNCFRQSIEQYEILSWLYFVGFAGLFIPDWNGGALFDPSIFDALYSANDVIDPKTLFKQVRPGKTELIANDICNGKKIVTISLNGTQTVITADGRTIQKTVSDVHTAGNTVGCLQHFKFNGSYSVTGCEDKEICLWICSDPLDQLHKVYC